MLFYELLEEKDDVNVFLDRLNDNKIKRALVLYIIDILKSQANVNKDYDDMLIRLVNELQLQKRGSFKMTNGDKLIAGILELEKIKRLEKEEKEKKIFINNLIIQALKKTD